MGPTCQLVFAKRAIYPFELFISFSPFRFISPSSQAVAEAEGALRRRFAIVGLFPFHFFFRCCRSRWCRSRWCGGGFGWIFAILMFWLFFYFVEAEFEVEAEGLVVVNSAFIGEFSL